MVKIPPDLQAVHAERFGQRWAVKRSWPKKLSPAVANRMSAEWVEQIKDRFKALRAAMAGELQTLTHREAHGLAGRWYTEFVGRHDTEPGDPEGWKIALENFVDDLSLDHDEASRILGDPVALGAHADEIATETRADAWLADHGYALAPESRKTFLVALAHAYIEALDLLRRRAEGDYSHDPIAGTFPTLEASTKPGSAVSIRELFDQWVTEVKPAKSTITRWSAVIGAVAEKWPDLRRVTESDARDWLKGLITSDRSAATVNVTWLAAPKTICNWAQREGRLKDNPFAKVRVSIPRKITTRESKAFTDQEAALVLRGTLAVEIRAPLDAAQRWLPWLCAYSGARAGEIAQLRGQDIREREGIWVMLLTPEAGTIKNKRPRTIPLHEHLIEQGFLDFVKTHGDGPLFFDPQLRNGEEKKVPYVHVIQRVGEWVRSLGIDDPGVSPNHAWRHRFKLVAERANVPERLSDYITGHAPASIGRAYGQPTLSDLAREIKKLPRYRVEP